MAFHVQCKHNNSIYKTLAGTKVPSDELDITKVDWYLHAGAGNGESWTKLKS